MSHVITVAAAQIDVKLFDRDSNLDKIEAFAREAARSGAQLVVFPEAAVAGYCYTSLEEALPYAEPVPGPATVALSRMAKGLGIHMVVGLLEEDAGSVYNAAVLAGPDGLIATHRKTHLPFLGIDRFVKHGQGPFRVHETPIGNIGMQVCYEVNFTEVSRSLALLGADILVLPTNWPQGRERVPEYIVHARAMENRVHLIACDRVGEERGFRFIGRSKIVDANGDAVASASADKEEIILAQIDLDVARNKHVVFKPGEFEVDAFGDRRPELYGPVGRHARVDGLRNNRGESLAASGSAG